MKIPLSWLRDYVNISLPPAELIERLTLAGLEIGGVRVLGLPVPEGVRVKAEEQGPVWDREKVVLARVKLVEKHPNADKLKLVHVEYGKAEPKVVVTGAPNIGVGDKDLGVVLGMAGCSYFDGHVTPKQLATLKPTKIRGVPSDAMVMSEFELGISEEHEGVIILREEITPGTPLVDFMGDLVLEADVLPNMARCLAMLGVAREVAALTGQRVQLPPRGMQAVGPAIEGQVKVEIEDAKLSARYTAALIKGVKIGPAPGWMQRRLTYAGMRPISNIVDVTNYVMLEWGQPLHAFDYDVLVRRAAGKAPTIIVRPARAGEVLVTLDDNKRELSPDNLVIADTAGPIALAGVMGGAETEVSETTTNILLESASFDAVSIRRTMKQFNLPSEASARFSRGIHPETVLPAAERAADLMRQFAGGTIAKGLADNYAAPLPAQIVDLDLGEVERVLGVAFSEAEARRILEALEFEVKSAESGRLQVKVPSHRLDIQEGAADLIEDLVRVHGPDRLPATLLADQLPRQQTNQALVFEERLRDILAGSGLQEVITYTLTMPEKEAPVLGNKAAEYVRLKNPVSSERVVMRQSVLASVLEVSASNVRQTQDVRLFEIGFVYASRPGTKLPDEPRRLALVMTGERRQPFWEDADKEGSGPPLGFYDLKGVIEGFVGDLHLGDVKYQPASDEYLHPGRAAQLVVGGKPMGVFGQLHPSVAQQYGLGERAILVGDFDVEALQAAAPARYAYTPIARFPAALRDIAVLVEETIPGERVAAEIRAAGGELIESVRLFDVYRGERIPAGTKSLAFALSYLAADRTLVDKEVDKAHKKIEERLKHILKAQIRGKE